MTSPTERLWNLPEKRRARLLDPAEEEFVVHGYEQASLNRILTAAGMSKGQAYYYITGKSDLYLAVCTRSFSPLLRFAEERSRALGDGSAFWPDVERVCGELAQQLAADEALSKLALGVYGSALATASLAPLSRQLDALLDRLISRGQRAGVIRSDLPDGLIRDMLKGLARSVDRWFALNAMSLSERQSETASMATFEMIRNMVKPPIRKDAEDA